MTRLAALLVLLFALLAASARAQTPPCTGEPVQLQVLGSGSGDLADGRAAPSALLWVDGKARLLIDTGPGAALRFAQVGAQLADLDAVLFTQLRAERSTDLAAIVQLTAPTPRKRALPVYGPGGNRWMPSTVTLVRTMFDPTRGAWRHLGEVLSPLTRGSYKLEPHDVRAPAPRLGVSREEREEPISVFANERLRVSALPRDNGPTPGLVWRIESGGKHFVLGTFAPRDNVLRRFVRDADVLVVTPVTADAAALGELASQTAAKQLILAARTHAGLGKEEETELAIRRHYAGALQFADDLNCIAP